MPLSRSGRSRNGGRIHERVATGWQRVEDGALYAARLLVKLNACRPTIKPTWKAAHRELIYDADDPSFSVSLLAPSSRPTR